MSTLKLQGRRCRLDFDDGFLYYKQKQFKDRLYLRCAVSSNLTCRASYVIYLEDGLPDTNRLHCIAEHNHPPDQEDVQTEKFLDQLKRAVEAMSNYPLKDIYNMVIEGFPDIATLYTYKSVARRMRYWGQIDKNRLKVEFDDLE